MTDHHRKNKNVHRFARRFKAARSIGGPDCEVIPTKRKKKVRRQISMEDAKWTDGNKSGKGRAVRTGLLAVVGIAIAAFFLVVAVTIFRDAPSGDEAGFETRSSNFGEMVEPVPALPPTEAVSRLKTLLASRDESEVEELIFPGAISPGEAVGFLEKFPYAAEIHYVGKLESSDIPAQSLIVVPARGPLAVVFFRLDREREWKIDFDAFARHSDVAIGKFVDGAVDSGTFRLTGAVDTYFNGKYRDDRVWSCYCLKSPDHDGVVYAYCRRDSPQGEAMYALEDLALRRGQDKGTLIEAGNAVSFRVTLGLKRIPGPDIRQVEIVSVVAEDWFVSGKDFDEAFKMAAE